MNENELSEIPIVNIDIKIPKAYGKNFKKHDEASVSLLAAGIKEWGQTQPILLDKDMVIIAGHGRLLACKKLGWKTIDARIMSHYTKDQANAVRINDNQVVSTEYDSVMARLAVEELPEYSAEQLGFTEAEFDKLLMDYKEIDISAFTQDLVGDVVAQAESATHDIAKSDLKMVSIATAMGFKSITTETSRKLAKFMAGLQERFDQEDLATAFAMFIAEEVV